MLPDTYRSYVDYSFYGKETFYIDRPRLTALASFLIDENEEWTMEKAAIYARVSTEDQEKRGISLDAQISRCARYLESLGLELVDTGIDALSGKDLNRPSLKRILNLAEKKKISHIAVWNKDRLSRDPLDALPLLKKLTRKSVQVHEVESNKVLSIQTAEDEMMLTVEWAFKKLERRKISDRTRMALARKKELGERISARPPYGYQFDGNKVVVNIQEQVIISRIQELHLLGYSERKLIDELSRQGVFNRHGKPFGRMAIRNILVKAPHEKKEIAATS